MLPASLRAHPLERRVVEVVQPACFADEVRQLVLEPLPVRLRTTMAAHSAASQRMVDMATHCQRIEYFC
jgi:hypothetical protein